MTGRPRCVVPESDGASLFLTRQEEDVPWEAFFTALSPAVAGECIDHILLVISEPYRNMPIIDDSGRRGLNYSHSIVQTKAKDLIVLAFLMLDRRSVVGRTVKTLRF